MTSYLYRADGVKVKKLFGDIETDYLDGLQYKSTFQIESWNGEGVFQPDPNEIPVLKLRIIPTAEGYYDVLNERYVYNYKDHLGNIRLSYTDTNKDGIIQPRRYNASMCSGKFCIDDWKPGEIVEVNNYYPFGMMHNYTSTTQNAYQYKYNGKELQESGMYDYGARMYMPDLGRWGVIDPLAEKSRRWSAYTYAYDNPVMFIDPDGRENVSALHWKFEQNSTILGNSWFDDSYVSSGFSNNFKTMWNGGDHGGSGGSFLESQMFKDAMAYLARPEKKYFQGSDFSAEYMGGITPQVAGLYAHSAMANFFSSDTRYKNIWFPEKTGSIWKLDMNWRSDLQYKNAGMNAVWELKPISNFINSSLSLSGKSQVKFYADMESYTQNKKFHVGSSNGAPIPPINGRTLTHMGYQFSYSVPFGTDGMIYYQCLNCQDPIRDPARQTQTNPNTANQMGTGLAIALLILNIAVRLIPN